MPRVVDPARQRAKRDAADCLAFAYNDVSVMADKAGELVGIVRARVGGSTMGDRMVRISTDALSLLNSVCESLRAARAHTQEIDVTVEAPDDSSSGG